MWIPRLLTDNLQRAMATRPALLLTGARQTGKSSLLTTQFPAASYYSLDHPAIAQAAAESPDHFLDSLTPPVILDEVQYAPSLFRQLKPRIDANRHNKGQYLLTGSQRFQLMAGVSESLAGRLRVLELGTLCAAELRHAELDTSAYPWRGGYPELWVEPQLDHREFFEDYLTSYLERDLNQIINISNLRDFRRLLLAVAVRTGQLMNYSDLAKDVGISANTAKSWINALDASALITILPPFHANIGKRLIKAPKLYFNDPGLLCHLLNIHDANGWHQHALRGALWENIVLQELRTALQLRPGQDLFFYRDQNGVEVDFLIDQGHQLTLVEAKASEQPDRRKLNFSKVTPLFAKHQIECWLACMSTQSQALQMGKYLLLNPLQHPLPFNRQ